MEEKSGFKIDLQIHLFFGANYNLRDILTIMEKRGLNGIVVLFYKWDKRTYQFFHQDLNGYETERGLGFICFTSKKTRNRLYMFVGEEVAPVAQRWHFISCRSHRY